MVLSFVLPMMRSLSDAILIQKSRDKVQSSMRKNAFHNSVTSTTLLTVFFCTLFLRFPRHCFLFAELLQK